MHRLWFYRGNATFEVLAFSLSTCLSLLFCTGLYCNGPVKFLLFLLEVAQQNRCMEIADGSDSFSRHLLLWSCFLPMSEMWSLDAKLRPSATHSANIFTTSVSGLACLALTIQIVLMYLGTVLHRTTDLYGWAGLSQSQWLPPKLDAVHYALLDAFATRKNWLTLFVISHPVVSRTMTLAASLVEALVPLFCLFSARWRHWGALIVIALHVGLLACFNLPNWQTVGMVTQLIWIPTHVWDQLLPISKDYKKTDGDHAPSAVLSGGRSDSSPRQLTPTPISLLFQLFFFSYMLYNWAGNRGWIEKLDHGDIGEGLVSLVVIALAAH